MEVKKSKEEILDGLEKDAKQFEYMYHGCGQCTLAAVLEALERREDTLFQAATAFAGGGGCDGAEPGVGAKCR